MYLSRSLSLLRSITNSFNDLNQSRSPNLNSSPLSTQSSGTAITSSFTNYRMHITRDREKAENALFEHVRKAVNSQETAPKQKHVRGKKNSMNICIYIYSFRMHCICLG